MPKTSKFLRTASRAPEIAKTKIPTMSRACWTEGVKSSLSTGQLCPYYFFGSSSASADGATAPLPSGTEADSASSSGSSEATGFSDTTGPALFSGSSAFASSACAAAAGSGAPAPTDFTVMTSATSGASPGAWSSPFSGWWHATWCPVFSWSSGGSVVLQICVAFQHRVWKRQPEGGEIGDGTSPLSRMRSLLAPRLRGSGTGTADMSAVVYGCIGASYSDVRSASSTILPRYMTAIRSETWRMTDRSCAMIMYV